MARHHHGRSAKSHIPIRPRTGMRNTRRPLRRKSNQTINSFRLVGVLNYTSEKQLPYLRLYFSYRELGTRFLLQSFSMTYAVAELERSLRL
jgi:hypothetical protein